MLDNMVWKKKSVKKRKPGTLRPLPVIFGSGKKEKKNTEDAQMSGF